MKINIIFSPNVMRFLFLLCLFFSYLFLSGCKKASNNNINENRIRYNGYTIPREGGEIEIQIDSISSMNELISGLANDYDLYETGKAYWIGYNNRMFSIAVHSNRAIEPLMVYIDTIQTYYAKVAAVLTLHLIGINCDVKGRFSEDFQNENARNALLSLLRNKSIQHDVLLLLIRNPWMSDVPKLFEILQSDSSDCWTICNALTLYRLPDMPIKEKNSDMDQIPNIFDDYHITIKKCHKSSNEQDFNSHLLRKFGEKYPRQIHIEDTLFHYDFSNSPLLNYYSCNDDSSYDEEKYSGKKITVSLKDVLRTSSDINYTSIGNNFQYIVKENEIFIFSSMTAKKLWLNWWNNKNESYKHSFKTNKDRFNPSPVRPNL